MNKKDKPINYTNTDNSEITDTLAVTDHPDGVDWQKEISNQERILNQTGAMARIGGWEHDLITGEAHWTKTLYDLIKIDFNEPVPGVNEHLSYYPPEDRKKLEEAYRNSMETGTPFDLELQCHTTEGELLWWRVYGEPVYEDGKCVKMRGTFQDIDTGKKLEMMLHEEKERAQKYLDIAGVIIVALDSEGKVTLINKKGSSILGYNQDELVCQNWFDKVIPPDQSDKVKEVFNQLMSGDIEPVEYNENFVVTKSGDFRLIAWNNTLLSDDSGRIIGSLSSGEDITDRRKAENELKDYQQRLEKLVEERTLELKDANRDLEDFAYSVSHDLKAPLRAIVGFSDIISRRYRDNLNEEGREYFDHILKSGIHMNQLIEDLLKYSRLGRQAVKRRPMPLTELFDTLREIFSDRINSLGGELVFPTESPIVLGDATLLKQIFINLIDNAIVYKDANRVPIVKLHIQSEDTMAIITIEDNGIGIPEEFHEKIFNIFQRLHSNSEIPGTGIGLAIVKKAVSMLGGSIGLESRVDEGSRFMVRLHLKKGSA